MEIIKVVRDQVIAKKNDIVKYWYLVQEGTVIQKFGFSEVKRRKGAYVVDGIEYDELLLEKRFDD